MIAEQRLRDDVLERMAAKNLTRYAVAWGVAELNERDAALDQSVYRWLRGEGTISVTKLTQIAVVLGRRIGLKPASS